MNQGSDKESGNVRWAGDDFGDYKTLKDHPSMTQQVKAVIGNVSPNSSSSASDDSESNVSTKLSLKLELKDPISPFSNGGMIQHCVDKESALYKVPFNTIPC